MKQTQDLINRFDKLELSISDELRERNDTLGKSENDRPEYRHLTSERISELKSARREYEVQVSKNGEERIKNRVEDFLSGLRFERDARMFPLKNSTNTENRRRSEFLDERAREVLSLIDGDPERFETEWNRATEFEYKSWLIYWTDLLKTFEANLAGLERYLKLKEEWSESLELDKLDNLISRVEEYREKLRHHYAFLGLNPSKDFREWEERIEKLSEGQIREDTGRKIL